MVEDVSPYRSPRRFYGRRKGRPLRKRKNQLLEQSLQQYTLTLPKEGCLDPAECFATTPDSVQLEIGFGGGEHLAAQAAQHPATGFLGCEPFINGVASLLDHIDRLSLTNIRLFPDDARFLLDALPDASIGRCFVLFADPWPKARHAERRFIGPENIPRLVKVLQKGAELRLATDDMQLATWMREHLQLAADFFTMVHDSPVPPVDWVTTRYQQKAIVAGRVPHYFSFQRR
jgi:tRNA (guanine-N7-)-methyltransferase